MLLTTLTTILQDAEISDVHIEEGEPLWYRRVSDMHRSDGDPVTREAIEQFMADVGLGDAKQLIGEMDKNGGDRDFATKVGPYSVRGNILFQNGRKLGVVLRKLAQEIPTAESLNLPAKFIELLVQSKGLLLVTGPTGSGKTTTLGAGIDYLNKNKRLKIITVEDPIEYRHRHKSSKVDQREVGRHKDADTFDKAVRAALREDPDVIMIGELRDRVTVDAALRAANTGHLVLATLHTNSAQLTIERFTSFFAAEEKGYVQQTLASVLLGVLSQVLVPVNPDSGKTGRALCYELLVNTPASRSVIKEGKPAQLFNIMETGSGDGHVLLNRNLLERARKGDISVDDARYFSYDPDAFDKELVGAY
ncbi:PilT/PilU family type 4a pilus ATPase [Paraburkholderia sp. UCT31]|uniref:type IV pilus twitching motility protein PilT n=1 Tax=Paraburkholderia sp. UCT31 TaxID=2615209 RepID=UPI001655FA03|nr:PilT/PilU family type 4a pilus ATPase [Paraburkholderia sp. UCT31]MBC8738474.1 PilT/PilU family type 4a pilus ATPase [Paraburkholderia sp. UCT31]